MNHAQVSHEASERAPEVADGSGAAGEERYTRLPPVNSVGLAKLQVSPLKAHDLNHPIQHLDHAIDPQCTASTAIERAQLSRSCMAWRA